MNLLGLSKPELIDEVERLTSALAHANERRDHYKDEIERLQERLMAEQSESIMSRELLDEARAENERLRKCCTQRGARMQIMREWLGSDRRVSGPPTEWWYFCAERPEAIKWFDDDGVPVDACD
jgi:hypothetical protein